MTIIQFQRFCGSHSCLCFSVFNPGVQRDAVTALCYIPSRSFLLCIPGVPPIPKSIGSFLLLPLHLILSLSNWNRTGRTPTAASLEDRHARDIAILAGWRVWNQEGSEIVEPYIDNPCQEPMFGIPVLSCPIIRPLE